MSSSLVSLSDVPETMLWTLHNRATEAKRTDSFLLDPEAERRRPFENLACIGRDGTVAWLAEVPEANDTFVRFHLSAGELWASTGTGRRVRIDLATGRAMEVR